MAEGLVLAFLVLGALATAGWRYRVTRPDYRLARRGDPGAEGLGDTVADLTNRLPERRGTPRPRHPAARGRSCA